MIQRIQTIYLLLATILMSLTLFLPLATIINGTSEIVVKAFAVSGLSDVTGTLPLYLGILLSITTALLMTIIFLFKKRMLQIRLCVSAIDRKSVV